MKKAFVMMTALLAASTTDATPYIDVLLGVSSQYTTPWHASWGPSGGLSLYPSPGLRAGYRFSDHFSIETAWTRYYGPRETEKNDHAQESSSTELVTNILKVGGAGMLPLTSRLALNAKAGITFWDFTIEHNYSEWGSGETISGKETYQDKYRSFYYGFGGSYRITNSIIIGFDTYRQSVELDEDESDRRYHINSGLLSLGWHF